MLIWNEYITMVFIYYVLYIFCKTRIQVQQSLSAGQHLSHVPWRNHPGAGECLQKHLRW